MAAVRRDGVRGVGSVMLGRGECAVHNMFPLASNSRLLSASGWGGRGGGREVVVDFYFNGECV